MNLLTENHLGLTELFFVVLVLILAAFYTLIHRRYAPHTANTYLLEQTLREQTKDQKPEERQLTLLME